MSLNQFVPGYDTTYEEIKTFYPVFYQEIQQMDALWKAYGEQADNLQEAINQYVKNLFILESDASTVYLWEEFLSLGHDYSKTLIDRKRAIIASMIGNSHIGRPEIVGIVALFTSAVPTVAFNKGIVTVTVDGSDAESFNIGNLYDLLDRKLPAHLALILKTLWSGNKVLNEYDNNFYRLIINATVNNGFVGEPIRLDGSQVLDGSWLLGADGERGLFFSSLKTTLGVQGDEHVRAYLTKDAMWQLDGSVLLDGSRTLDAEYTRSEV